MSPKLKGWTIAATVVVLLILVAQFLVFYFSDSQNSRAFRDVCQIRVRNGTNQILTDVVVTVSVRSEPKSSHIAEIPVGATAKCEFNASELYFLAAEALIAGQKRTVQAHVSQYDWETLEVTFQSAGDPDVKRF